MDLATKEWKKKPEEWCVAWKVSFREFNKIGMTEGGYRSNRRLRLYEQFIDCEKELLAMIKAGSVDIDEKWKLVDQIKDLQFSIEQLEQNVDSKTGLIRNSYGTTKNPFSIDRPGSKSKAYVTNPYDRPVWFLWEEEHLRYSLKPFVVFDSYLAIRNLGDFPHRPFQKHTNERENIDPDLIALKADQKTGMENMIAETSKPDNNETTKQNNSSSANTINDGIRNSTSDPMLQYTKSSFQTPLRSEKKPSPVRTNEKPRFTPLPLASSQSPSRWNVQDINALDLLLKSAERRQYERSTRIAKRRYAAIQAVARDEIKDSRATMEASFSLIGNIFGDNRRSIKPASPMAALDGALVEAIASSSNTENDKEEKEADDEDDVSL